MSEMRIQPACPHCGGDTSRIEKHVAGHHTTTRYRCADCRATFTEQQNPTPPRPGVEAGFDPLFIPETTLSTEAPADQPDPEPPALDEGLLEELDAALRTDPRLEIEDIALYLQLLFHTAEHVPYCAEGGAVVAAPVQFLFGQDDQPPARIYQSAGRLREFGYLVDTPMHGPLLLPPAPPADTRAARNAARAAVARLHA